MALNPIKVFGARVHNLKNISVTIPRNKITVLTGISGSGKSSLAFDTIFAEGQRRYVESLSAYARQFLGLHEKPDVDDITGLSPAISIDQKSAIRSPRSTVGTMSEIYDYLRLLFTTIGRPHCPSCQKPMASDSIRQTPQSTRLQLVCRTCQIKYPPLSLALFSFNSPIGACPTCRGLGRRLVIDPRLVIPNERLTLNEGAIRPWSRISGSSRTQQKNLESLAQTYHFSLDQPVSTLSIDVKKILLYGTSGTPSHIDWPFEGVIANLERRHRETDSEYVRREIEKYMVERVCPTCLGARLKQEALAVKIADQTIVQLAAMTIEELRRFTTRLIKMPKKLNTRERRIGGPIIREVIKRSQFLIDVGLGYLSLDRSADTLAGGEAQRIRLAAQLGSGLMNVIYILDEPSIGLHPKDHGRLLKSLQHLRDLGNTVIIVEHDRQTIEASDYIIDIGPGAGEAGGQVVCQGSLEKIKRRPQSLTGQYLANKRIITYPQKRRSQDRGSLKIVNARHFNLKNLSLMVPLGRLTVVTGVSGSGKSTLVDDVLGKALLKHFYRSSVNPGLHDRIEGLELIDKVVIVDQTPIGRTPRSNPATYTGVFTPLRAVFASTPLAKRLHYKANQFSFNLRGGRCETCRGDGVLKFEMHFLPNVFVTCEACDGRRYNEKTLVITYKNQSIADVLNMTVGQASLFFAELPEIVEKLQVMQRVGLGYIKLGQPATTLSGGEAQRVKLATELARPTSGKTLYILDEPTTGLHFEDIKYLLDVLHGLVDRGNTVLVVEHNLDVIKNADWVIDLGPEAGEAGGRVVAEGTPETVAQAKNSYTGQYLKKSFQLRGSGNPNRLS